MKKYMLPIAAALIGVVGVQQAVSAKDVPTVQPVDAEKQRMIERGKFLVTITGCGHCHSPHDQTGKPIPGRELSGHPAGAPLPTWRPEMLKEGNLVTIAPTFTAFAGPFGLSVAGNLTPDMETGIGMLTAEMLIESWRSGKHWKFDNRPVLPPMPTFDFGIMPDEDIRAIHAYLTSLKPVRNEVPLSKPVDMGK
jgi:hypothetical protein